MENGSFTGLIGALERDEADIAIQVKLAFWASYVRKLGSYESWTTLLINNI